MLSKMPLILDFGCGRQYFKKTSSFKNVIGYDIVPEFSDVSDYSTLKPDIILCNHTLEDFKRMKPKFIITGIPTENMISKACAMIGKPHGYFEHKTSITRIHREMTKRFNLLSRKNVMTLTMVSKWQ